MTINEPNEYAISEAITARLRLDTPSAEVVQGKEGFEAVHDIETNYLPVVTNAMQSILYGMTREFVPLHQKGNVREDLIQRFSQEVHVVVVRDLRERGLWLFDLPNVLFVNYQDYLESKDDQIKYFELLATLAHEYTHKIHLHRLTEISFANATVPTDHGYAYSIWTELTARHMDRLVLARTLKPIMNDTEQSDELKMHLFGLMKFEQSESSDLAIRDLFTLLMRNPDSLRSDAFHLLTLQNITGLDLGTSFRDAIVSFEDRIMEDFLLYFGSEELAYQAFETFVDDLSTLLRTPYDEVSSRSFAKKYESFRENLEERLSH